MVLLLGVMAMSAHAAPPQTMGVKPTVLSPEELDARQSGSPPAANGGDVDKPPSAAERAAASAVPADADTLSGPDLARYQKELESMQRLQRDTQMLRLMTEKAKLESELRRYREQAGESNGSPDMSVAWLTATSTRRQARIQVGDASVVLARPGDILPNGWRVATIDSTGVIVEKNGVRLRLPFAAVKSPEAS